MKAVATPSPQSPTPELFAGSVLRWHVLAEDTGGTLSLGDAVIRPGGEPPLHVHAREDETFYVLEGTVIFQRGHERIDAGPGDCIFMPRGIQHGFAVRSDLARMIQMFTPGGLEQAFRSLSVPAPGTDVPAAPTGPPDADAVAEMASRFGEYGVVFEGPPLPALLAEVG